MAYGAQIIHDSVKMIKTETAATPKLLAAECTAVSVCGQKCMGYPSMMPHVCG